MRTQKRICAICITLVCLAVAVQAASGQHSARPAPDQVAYYNSYTVPSGSAKALAQIMSELYLNHRPVTFTATDDETVWVFAKLADHVLIEMHLNVPRKGNDTTDILILPNADVRKLAAVINERLSGIPDAPLVKDDESKNAIIVIGTAERLRAVKAMIDTILAQGLGTKSGEPIMREVKKYHFEFDQAPWSKVLDWLVEITGLPLSGSNRVPTGSLTFTPEIGADGKPKLYTVPEIIDELNETLAKSKGQHWIILRRQTPLGIYPGDEPFPVDLVKMIGLYELYSRDFGKTEFVGLKYQLTIRNAERTAKAIKGFMSPYGQVVPVAEANQLILVDSAGSLRKVVHKIEEFEMARGG